LSTDGRGAGRRPRSSPSTREACTWRRGPASRQGGCWDARRPLVNTDESELALFRAERRVREIQAKLHRWADHDPQRDLWSARCPETGTAGAGGGSGKPTGGNTGRGAPGRPHGGVHRHRQAEQTGSVGEGLQFRHDQRPHLGALSATEQPVDRLPVPVALGHIPPGRADPYPPTNTVDQLPTAHFGRRPGRLPFGSSGSRIRHCRSVRSLRAPIDSLPNEVSG